MNSRAELASSVIRSSCTRLSDYLELTKPGITAFVVLSLAVGFVVGSPQGVDAARLIHVLLATVLIAAGAAALNQFAERKQDALMRRTESRPLPTGRLAPDQVLLFGLLLSTSGLVYMGMTASWLASLVGGATSVIYLLLYTPLKQRTTLNTAVGAVAGALPPVGGWAAARGTLELEAWVLFAIVFLWQIPHFFSIAWIYRHDYGRGGYRMVPVEDPAGARTARHIITCCALLLPVSVLPCLVFSSGPLYMVFAAAAGGGMIVCSLGFVKSRSTRLARRLLRATLIYLPLLWSGLMLDMLWA